MADMNIETKFYCPNCNEMQNCRINQTDIVCNTCDFIIATFQTQSGTETIQLS